MTGKDVTLQNYGKGTGDRIAKTARGYVVGRGGPICTDMRGAVLPNLKKSIFFRVSVTRLATPLLTARVI